MYLSRVTLTGITIVLNELSLHDQVFSYPSLFHDMVYFPLNFHFTLSQCIEYVFLSLNLLHDVNILGFE